MSALASPPVLAGVLVAAAVALLVPGHGGWRRAGGTASGAGAGARLQRVRLPWPALLGTLLWISGTGLLAALVGAALLAGVLGGRRRAVTARRRADQEARAAEACGVLADELRAGRTPGDALASAVEVDPVLSGVRRVAEAGGDVPTALCATEVRGYVVVAAAWQVAEQHGTGLGESVRRVLAHLRADRATQRTVAAELASARSTAKLLAALPAFALLAATASGGRPWEFLLHTPFGAGCLLLGLLLGWLGLRWIDAVAGGVAGSR